jgi:uncharacterized protein YjbJ (UPF0337 family)
MMNSKTGTSSWNEQKAKLKQKFAILTGNDLLFEEGRREEMMQKLQIILGKSKEELAFLISNL